LSIIDKTIKQDDPLNNDLQINPKMFNVPHYILYFMNVYDNLDIFKVDLLSHKITNKDNCDFDVNSLMINGYSISMLDSSNDNMLSIIMNIINKSARSMFDYKKHIDDFHGIFDQKRKIMNKVLYYITYRTKILELGYSQIYSYNRFHKIPEIKIETTEVCPISGMPPPYLKIKLVCNHYISLMEFAGLINVEQDATQSVKCSLCRKDLIIDLTFKSTPRIHTPRICYMAGDEDVEMNETESSDLHLFFIDF
jgi:hypothetical protein